MTDWVVPWAAWTWAFLIALLLGFELYTLWYNRKHPGKRANLTAYIQAYFRRGKRRMLRSAPPWILVLIFVYFLGHFMAWWR